MKTSKSSQPRKRPTNRPTDRPTARPNKQNKFDKQQINLEKGGKVLLRRDIKLSATVKKDKNFSKTSKTHVLLTYTHISDSHVHRADAGWRYFAAAETVAAARTRRSDERIQCVQNISPATTTK